MKSSLVRFSEFHDQVKETYPKAVQGTPAPCLDIAVSIGRLLRAEGEPAALLGMYAEGHKIIPKPYKGRVQWDMHAVCEAGGVVYDPILPLPVAFEEYFVDAIDQPVIMFDITRRHFPISASE